MKNIADNTHAAFLKIKNLFGFAFFLVLMTVSSLSAGSLLPPMNGSPLDFAPRRSGGEVNASLKLTVLREGLYVLKQKDLINAGMDPRVLIGEQIRLYCTTQEVALYVSNAGLWTSEDFLVFFGKSFEGGYTDKNAYWLGLGGIGKRMAFQDGTPFEGAPEIKTCEWRSHYRPNGFMQTDYQPENDKIDHWFAKSLDDKFAATLSLSAEKIVPSTSARLSVVLYGVTSSGKVNPDHRTRVKVNGKNAADFVFDGQNAMTGSCELSSDMLVSSNTVWFKQMLGQGLTSDSVLLKEASLDYTRKLQATANSLTFTGQVGTNNYRIQGFTSRADYWVLDVTDPDSPVILSDFTLNPEKKRYTLRFGDESRQARRYSVCPASQAMKVSVIEAVTFAGLAATDLSGAYLVICPEPFRKQAERLVAWRRSQGLPGLVVALPDIYNEFSYGLVDADAIKQFLGYAFHHWDTPPQYVLLAGSGSYDPKGNLLAWRGKKAVKAMERMPLHMGPSIREWTSMDGWYAQVAGADKKVDFALGRLPARNAAMLSDMVDKIVAYESAPLKDPSRKQALLVADKPDAAQNGKASCEEARTAFLTPGGFGCKTAYNEDLDLSVARRRVASYLNTGVALACYFGHGSVDHWGDGLLTTADADALQNSSYPIMLMMACLTGSLQNPLDGPCLMESLMGGKGRGASACIANTAPAYGPMAEAFAMGFLRTLATEKGTRIGDAFMGGMADLNTFNGCTQELLYLNLFGDPAMVVNR